MFTVRQFLKTVLVAVAAGGVGVSGLVAAPKALFSSKVVTGQTPGHAVAVDADLTGAKKLFLVVDDGGNGYSCDWADWVEPVLTVKGQEVRLTDLKWKKASAGWGSVTVGKNAGGGALMVEGKPVAFGIGVHAVSMIEYDLPAGTTRFRARGALDDGGVNQAGGNATSVRFHVYTEKPKVRATGGSGGALEPEESLEALETHEGLETTLFASEPMLLSPTNIDVDHRGRVWVCEVVNYRHRNGERPEGDRILILEDTDGDGVADDQKVFYQGRDIDSALGICVLGNRVIVSVSPNIFVFTDTDGDDKADRKDVLFSKIDGKQHDHSAHAFVFGPDGKLYWNFGNYGRRVSDKDGKLIVDKAGNEVTDQGKPYRQGMIFRCNLDGSEFETLAWNFRNNYEVAVDSFGTMWQSDNDDDGNRGVRINYVMEYGNYGYTEEFSGAGWKKERIGMSAEIPKRHWYQNDPGVVPNLVQTGGGSPCGIIAYEGTLLPELFQNEVIHADAGPNVVWSFPAEKDGAGYSAETVNITKGVGDRWFRPSDVCTAPDGSVIVADWYDPGVGGHRMGEAERGRLFRIAPPGTAYRIPKADFSTLRGAIDALRSPNQATRYLAWQKLHGAGLEAERALVGLARSENPRHKARAVWLLTKLPGERGEYWARQSLRDANPDIRIVAIRAARQLGMNMVEFIQPVLNDAPEVRRECAIALSALKSEAANSAWATLAAQHTAGDRWYLEALGIGARGDEEGRFAAWRQKAGAQWGTPAGQEIVWRSRAEAAVPMLAQSILNPEAREAERNRYFRAFDFHPGGRLRDEAMLALITGAGNHPDASTIVRLALERVQERNLDRNPTLRAAINKQVSNGRGTVAYVELVRQFDLQEEIPNLLRMAASDGEINARAEAVEALFKFGHNTDVAKLARSKNAEAASNVMEALGRIQRGPAFAILKRIFLDEQAPMESRRFALRNMRNIREAELFLLNDLVKPEKMPEAFRASITQMLHGSADQRIRAEADKLLPLPATAGNEALPPITELIKLNGDATRGKPVFAKATCITCHQVNGEGINYGPNLSEIGSKLSRDAMYEAILDPNAGITHGYYTIQIEMNSGESAVGFVTSETAKEVTLTVPGGLSRTFPRNGIKEMKKLEISLMPPGLERVMTKQELVDLVGYLESLKKAE